MRRVAWGAGNAPLHRQLIAQRGVRRSRKGKLLNHEDDDSIEDDYGFWDDHRSISMTGPITRPNRVVRQRPPDSASPRTARHRVSAAGPFWNRVVVLGLVAILAIAVALAVGDKGTLSKVAALDIPSANDAVAISFPDDTAATTPPIEATIAVPAAEAASIPAPAPAPKTEAAVKSAAGIVQVAAVPAVRSSTTSASTQTSCANTYKVVVRDYWILIAKKANVTLKSLLAINKATTKTPLYAGRSVCLPAGATAPVVMKAPPTTVKATAAAQASATPAKAPSTTAKAPAAPAPTPPPTPAATPSPAAAPSRSYSSAEVEQIIRDVWPDDLEDHAVAIAKRESNLQPTARNYCCIGLFQIYWNVHKSWLIAVGVTSADQLLDPRTNAGAAYFLYLRNGGWGPWGG